MSGADGRAAALTVDIWSDVVCPWCAIGYVQFSRSVSDLRQELAISVRWMPFELNPDMPPEGKLQADHMRDNYDSSPEQIAQMNANMRDIGRRVGFAMEYTGADPDPPAPRMWNTFDAHKLLRWVLAEEDEAAQTRLKLAFFRAHFQQRRNIGERAVLLDIAQSEGFERSAVEAALDDEALAIAVRVEEKRGLAAGINSVPSFVLAGQYLIQGAREPAAYADALRKAAALVAGGG